MQLVPGWEKKKEADELDIRLLTQTGDIAVAIRKFLCSFSAQDARALAGCLNDYASARERRSELIENEKEIDSRRMV